MFENLAINNVSKNDAIEGTLPDFPCRIGQMVDSSLLQDDREALREMLRSEGYLYFRQILPRELIERFHDQILTVRDRFASQYPDRPVGHIAFLPRDEYENTLLSELHNLEGAKNLPYLENLSKIISAIVTEPVYAIPRRWIRMIHPEAVVSGSETPIHQDFVALGTNPDIITAWVPISKSNVISGGLRILAGSHHLGPIPEEFTPEGKRTLCLPERADKLQWVCANYEPGDLVIIHGMTAHGAGKHSGDQIRLSMDMRYQTETEPLFLNAIRANYKRAEGVDQDDPADWSHDPKARAPQGTPAVSKANFDPQAAVSVSAYSDYNR